MYARSLQADGLDSLLNLCYARIQTIRTDFNSLASKDSFIIVNYKNQMAIAEEEKRLLLATITDKNKEITRERRKRRLVTFAGILTTGAAIFLSTIIK